MKKHAHYFLVLSLAFLAGNFASADVIDFFANAENGRRLEFGSGGDGAFANGPAQTGITVALPAITIDTDVKSVYEFTSFSLSAGITINATGAAPLVIRVRGPVSIAGSIRLDGALGGPSLAAGPGVGGSAGAGGGTGGLGGEQPPADIDGADGLPRTGYAIGGGGGLNIPGLGLQQEGGGGCNGPGATGGASSPTTAASCPFGFVEVADRFEIAFGGGGGGGGGGTRNVDIFNLMNGAGGGGAGGGFHLTAEGDTTISGTISADGGDGGNGDIGTSDYGSSGGGGSGGSIWVQSAGRLSGSGTLTVANGVGGQDGFSASIGGDGSRGVVRLDSTTNAFTGTFAPGGSADRTYTVYPVTVEFGISAGPACGTITGREAPRDFAVNAAIWAFIVFLGSRYRRPNGRLAMSSRSGRA